MWELDQKEGWALKTWSIQTWRRLLRVPWTDRRSDQSVLKEINPEYSLEGLMLKLRLQYTLATWCKEPTHWKRPWSWERLKSGGKEGDRGWDGLMASPTQWTWIWATLGNGGGEGKLPCCSPWNHRELDTSEELNNSKWQTDIQVIVCWDGAILPEGKKMEGSCWALFWRIDIEPVSRNAKGILEQRKSLDHITIVCTPDCNVLRLENRALIFEDWCHLYWLKLC